MQITPEGLEHEFSLTTAATRLNFLSRRDNGDTALNRVVDADDEADGDDWRAIRDSATSLDLSEALELLALGEVVARKAHRSRLIGMRAALRNGASWTEIGAALGTTPEAAWDAFQDAVAGSLDDRAAAAARDLAGARPTA